jgi:hypothetical protein
MLAMGLTGEAFVPTKVLESEQNSVRGFNNVCQVCARVRRANAPEIGSSVPYSLRCSRSYGRPAQ